MCPSANFYDCKAMAIGARSQSARTYLEKSLDDVGDCELEPLVAHGLRALRDTLPNEVDLTNKVSYASYLGKNNEIILKENMKMTFAFNGEFVMYFQNVSIAIVGEDTEFVVHEDSDVDRYLELIAGEERRNQVNAKSSNLQTLAFWD